MRLYIGPPMVFHMAVVPTLTAFLRRYGQSESARSFMADWWKLCKFGRSYDSEWNGRRAPIDHAIAVHNTDFGRESDQPTLLEVMSLVGTLPEDTQRVRRRLARQESTELQGVYRVIYPTELEVETEINRDSRDQWIRQFAAVGWEVEE